MNTNFSIFQNAHYHPFSRLRLTFLMRIEQKISKHINPHMTYDAHISHFNTSEMLASTQYFCTKFRTGAFDCPNSTVDRN